MVPFNRGRKRLCRKIRSALIAAIGAGAWHSSIAAAPYSWDAGSSDNRWLTSANWNPNSVPIASSDVTFGSGVSDGLVIDGLLGFQSTASLFANSISIATPNAFSIHGTWSSLSAFHSTLTLTSGDLTRQQVVGTEGEHVFKLEVLLAADGVWDVNGSNRLVIDGRLAGVDGGGPRNFTKTGSGTLLVRSNASSGNFDPLGLVTVSEGFLDLSGSLPADSIRVLSGATLDATSLGFTPVALNGNGVAGPLPINAAGALRSQSGNRLVHGVVTLQSDSTINVEADSLAFYAAIADGAATSVLTKRGAGEMILTVPGTYNGGTNVFGGQLTLENASATGTGPVTVSGSGALALKGSLAFVRPVSLNGSGPGGVGALRAFSGSSSVSSLTLAGSTSIHVGIDAVLSVTGAVTDNSGNFSLTKLGPGAMRLHQPNTIGGGLTIADGTVRPLVAAALPAGAVTVQDGGTLELTNGNSYSRDLRLSGTGHNAAGALTVLSGTSNSWAGSVTLDADASIGVAAGTGLTLSGPLAGAFTLSKTGDGNLVLASTATGLTGIDLNAGTLTLPSGASLTASTALRVAAGSSAVVNGTPSVPGPARLNGAGVGAGVGALHATAGANALASPVELQSDSVITAAPASVLTLSGPTSGNFKLTKSGPGELVLTGNNTHGAGPAAGTRVAEGVLTLASSAAAPPNTVFRVEPSATLQLRGGIATPASTALDLSGTGFPPDRSALHSAQGDNTWRGPVLLKSPTAVSAAAGSTLTLSGVITDDASRPPLVKNGPGNLVLTAANTYAGGTIASAGALSISSDANLGHPLGPVTLNNGARLLVTANTTTSRAFNLNTGSIQPAQGVTFTYSNATVSGGFLRGPGTHEVGAGSSFAGVTSLSGSNLALGGAATLTNFTNGGNVTNAAAPLSWDGGQNSGSGVLTVNNTVHTTAFVNYGVIRLNPGGLLSNSANPLVSGGGSEITVNPAAQLQLNGTTLDLRDALLVNNGAIAGGTLNIHYGALAAGTGTFPTVVLHPGGAFTPGVSLGNIPAPGPLSSGSIAPLDPDQTANAAVELRADTTATVNAADHNLTVTGSITGPGHVLTKTGAGTLVVHSITARGLKIDQGAVRVLPEGGDDSLSVLNTLTLAGSPDAWTVQLDLADNAMIVHKGNHETLRNQARSGRAGGAWTGPGLASTAAASDPTRTTALAVLLNDAGDGSPLFDKLAGQAVDPDAVLAAYTYNGDTDLSGAVDGDDYTRTDRGFLRGGPADWLSGDFNYDGRVDIADYFLLDQAHAMQGGPLGGAAMLPAVAAAVPEPAALGALAFAATIALRRRRRP